MHIPLDLPLTLSMPEPQFFLLLFPNYGLSTSVRFPIYPPACTPSTFSPRAVVFSLCVTLLRFGWFLVAGQARMRRGTEGKCYESKIVCRGMEHRTVLMAISGRFGGSESSSRGLVAVAVSMYQMNRQSGPREYKRRIGVGWGNQCCWSYHLCRRWLLPVLTWAEWLRW